jgi:hypothetical protein
MNSSSEKLYEYLGYGLLAAIFFIISQASMDMWDGVVASYGSEAGNIEGSRTSLLRHGWYLQHLLYIVLFWLTSFGLFSFFKLATFISFVSTVLLAREIFIFTNRVIRFEYFYSICALYFFIVFPVWQIFFSSIHIIFSICIFLCFFGTRLACTGSSILTKSFGYLAIILSLQLSSMLVLAPCLSYVYHLAGKNGAASFKLPNINTLFIFFISVLIYLLLKIVFPSEAQESYDYNSIINPFASSANFLIFFGSLKSFATFFITFLIPASVFLMLSIFTQNNYLKEVFIFLKQNSIQSFMMSILIASSTFSYLMVGKAPELSFAGVAGWGMRHSLVLATVFPIFLIWIFRSLSLGNKHLKLSYIFLCLTFLMSAMFLVAGIASKVNRIQFQEQLIEALQKEELSPGIIYFKFLDLSELPDPQMRDYERNYTFYRAYGNNIDSMIFFVSSDSPKIQDENITKYELDLINSHQQNTEDQLLSIFIPSDTSVCKSIIETKISNFQGFTNIMKNIMGFGRSVIELKVNSANCLQVIK